MGRLTPTNYSFSHSEMTTFKECKRRWYLHYYLGLRRRKSGISIPRETGTVVHQGLHLFYTAGGLDGPNAEELMFRYLENARDADLVSVAEEERKDILNIHDTAMILCRGYLEWLHETGADVGLRFDQSEVELRAPGPVEGTEIMGIIDLGGTHEQSGDLFVMDTKTTNSFNTMLQTLHIQEQPVMYAVLAMLNETEPRRGFRIIWNMLKRNKQTAKAKPPFYQRYELAMNMDMLRQFYLQLQGQIEDVLRTEARLNAGEPHVQVAYPTPTGDCSWKCPFFQVCGPMNDLSRNDVDFLVNAYYSTPDQREAAKLEEEKEAARTTREGE